MAKGEPQCGEGNRSEVVNGTLGSRKEGAKKTFPAIGKNSGRLRELMAGALAGMVALAGCKTPQPETPQSQIAEEIVSPWSDPSPKKENNAPVPSGPYTDTELARAKAAMNQAVSKLSNVPGVQNPWKNKGAIPVGKQNTPPTTIPSGIIPPSTSTGTPPLPFSMEPPDGYSK